MTGKPRLVPNVVRGELPDGEVVVSVPGGTQALILNAVADVLLELCDGSRTLGEIADFIRTTLTVPADADVVADVSSVLLQLQRAGVIEAVA